MCVIPRKLDQAMTPMIMDLSNNLQLTSINYKTKLVISLKIPRKLLFLQKKIITYGSNFACLLEKNASTYFLCVSCK
jgi:hypothetical protein